MIGVHDARLWLHTPPGTLSLLTIDGLNPIADKAAIRSKLGQALELPVVPTMTPYTGQLRVTTADGKPHLVGVDLSIDQPGLDTPVPPDRYCDVGAEGIIGQLRTEGLPPSHRPATGLATGEVFALRNAPKERLLYAVDATTRPAKVLWRKTLRDMVGGAEEPLLAGMQPAGPRRVAVMLATRGPKLHLVFIDHVDGSEIACSVLDPKKPWCPPRRRVRTAWSWSRCLQAARRATRCRFRLSRRAPSRTRGGWRWLPPR